MADEPTLYEGDVDVTGWVAEAQRLLAERGQASSDPSGTYGDDTARCVRSFQEANSATVDGIVGNQTWSLLYGRDPEPPGRINEPYGNTAESAAGGSTEATSGSADVPAEVVALGFPPSWESWTDEQKQTYFGTRDTSGDVSGDAPESFEVAAIETGNDGEAMA